MKTKIQWTNETWNPTTGCNKISAGCTNCYAADIAKRFWGDRPFEDVQFHRERLGQPLRKTASTLWFVNSMSDLFHDSVTDEALDLIFAVMALCQHHTFQILTKRPERMRDYCNSFTIEQLRRAIDNNTDIFDRFISRRPFYSLPKTLPLSNVWLGVSVENQLATRRIKPLLETSAALRFLSCEPLLGPVDLMHVQWPERTVDVLRGGSWIDGHGFVNHSDMPGFDDGLIGWVICGGESGPRARPMQIEWARSLMQQCRDAEVPFFMKQLGNRCEGLGAEYSGKGVEPSEWPKDLQVRQIPEIKHEIPHTSSSAALLSGHTSRTA